MGLQPDVGAASGAAGGGGGGGGGGPTRPHSSRDRRHFVQIEALTGLPHADVAQDILCRLAADCEPLMNAHAGWRGVPSLFEIYPADGRGPRGAPLPKDLDSIRGSLGGYTRPGIEICVVLRDETRPDTFLVYAQVLDVMLHELAHQSYGNHGPGFGALWTKLQQEYMHFRTQRMLGSALAWGASPRAESFSIEGSSYGVGINTSGAFRVNTQTKKERYTGALYLAPTMSAAATRKAHFSVVAALDEGQRLGQFGAGGGGFVLGTGERVGGPPGAAPGSRKRKPTKKKLREIMAAAAETRTRPAPPLVAAPRETILSRLVKKHAEAGASSSSASAPAKPASSPKIAADDIIELFSSQEDAEVLKEASLAQSIVDLSESPASPVSGGEAKRQRAAAEDSRPESLLDDPREDEDQASSVDAEAAPIELESQDWGGGLGCGCDEADDVIIELLE